MKKIFLLAASLLLTHVFAADAQRISIDASDPLTIAIRHSMQQRSSRLVYFYNPGVVGLKNNGDVEIRDYSKVTKIAARQAAEKLVDAENADRRQLVAAIARHYKRPEATDEIRALFTRRWADEMKSGWWVQEAQGDWVQKP